LREAGAVLLGKTTTPEFGCKGETNSLLTGISRNPWNPARTPGGSSGGASAAVSAGLGPLAIGTDGAGSVRIPAAFCGNVGLKPSFGRVPAYPLSPFGSVAHLGPHAMTVEDVALLMNTIALPDARDWTSLPFDGVDYTDQLLSGIKGLRIGVVKEGFGWPNSMAASDAKVRAAAAALAKAGAIVEDVSIPMHLVGPAIWLPIAAEGATQQMMKDNGHGFNWKGLYVTGMVDFHAGWKSRADELSETLKLTMVLGEYFIQHYRGHYYAKAQNLSRQLRKAYDDAFAKYDLLLMPTVPLTATPLPKPGAEVEEVVQEME
jgi:amidase